MEALNCCSGTIGTGTVLKSERVEDLRLKKILNILRWKDLGYVHLATQDGSTGLSCY